MLNFITFLCLVIVFIPGALILEIVYPFSKKLRLKASDFCVRYMPKSLFGVLKGLRKFQFYAYENPEVQLPEQFSVIINHQSLFDIPALMLYFRNRKIRFIAKDSLKYGIPMISPMLRAQGHCLISNKKGTLSAISLITNFGKWTKESGLNPIIFPEGTRTKTGELGKFYSAGFRTLSDAAKLPVVVCALDGGWKLRGAKGVLKNLKKGAYRVKVLKVYDVPNDKEDCARILEEGRELIQSQLNEWRALPADQK